MRLPPNSSVDLIQPQVFSWELIPAAIEYQIQIATDFFFTDLIYQLETADTSIELWGLPTEVTLHWRVRHREV